MPESVYVMMWQMRGQKAQPGDRDTAAKQAEPRRVAGRHRPAEGGLALSRLCRRPAAMNVGTAAFGVAAAVPPSPDVPKTHAARTLPGRGHPRVMQPDLSRA